MTFRKAGVREVQWRKISDRGLRIEVCRLPSYLPIRGLQFVVSEAVRPFSTQLMSKRCHPFLVIIRRCQTRACVCQVALVDSGFVETSHNGLSGPSCTPQWAAKDQLYPRILPYALPILMCIILCVFGRAAMGSSSGPLTQMTAQLVHLRFSSRRQGRISLALCHASCVGFRFAVPDQKELETDTRHTSGAKETKHPP